MRRALVLLLALVAIGDAGAATPQSISLPSPLSPLSSQPPLVIAPPTSIDADATVIQPRARSRQRVTVDLDADAHVRRVVDVHRLEIVSAGDYSFVVGAPAVSVEAAPGSATEPGQRHDAVIWQGFSPGRRVLAARIVLRTAEAAPLLPLRVEVERGAAETLVRLVNATRVRATAVTGAVEPADALRVLDELRRGSVVTRPVVRVRGDLKPTFVDVQAPLDVRGQLRAGGRAVPVRGRLAGRPLVVRVPGTGDLRIQLTARAVAPRPPVPRNAGPRRLLDLATRALLETARARQYDTFLQAPPLDTDPRTTYVYRTTRARTEAAPAAPAGHDDDTARLIVAIVAAALAAGALVVVWAHL